MIRQLVWLDTNGLVNKFAEAIPRAMVPWASQEERLGEPMEDIRRRQSLLQWHVNKNVLPVDINTLLSPTLDAYTTHVLPMTNDLALPRSRRPLPPVTRQSPDAPQQKWLSSDPTASRTQGDPLAWAKAPELKDALLEVSPAFFSLVREAARKDPGTAPRLWRRVAAALTTLVWWNAGRLVRAGPQRQYPLMNAFLEQILVTVTDCQSVLGCRGEDECVINAVQAEQMSIQRVSTNRRVTTRQRRTATRLDGKQGKATSASPAANGNGDKDARRP